MPMTPRNRTKIIATLGPATRHPEVLAELVRAGADCFRINLSHITAAEAQPVLKQVREVCDELGVYVPVLADIQGPKLRIGKMPSDGVLLREGKPFTLTTRELEVGDETTAPCHYEHLPHDVKPGTHILLADGTIELTVEKVEGKDVLCKITTGGRLYSNKGLNIPRTKLTAQTLTEKDRRDLEYIGSNEDVDMVAVSFVRSAADIRQAREYLGQRRDIPVMAKLEVPEVLENLDDVLNESDGVMIARGDLAVEVPFEQVPGLQKSILRQAAARGKWTAVATQMLGSMILNNRPTRAEVSDVANAVLDGADAIMLSEETATGGHPVETVRAMANISMEAETLIDPSHTAVLDSDITSFAAGAAHAAVTAARQLNAKAIVALAGSGLTALAVSKWRPSIPVLAMSVKQATLRRLNVLRGVEPVALAEKMSLEQQILAADERLLQRGWAQPGDITVAVAAVPLGEHKETNTIRLHRVRPGK